MFNPVIISSFFPKKPEKPSFLHSPKYNVNTIHPAGIFPLPTPIEKLLPFRKQFDPPLFIINFQNKGKGNFHIRRQSNNSYWAEPNNSHLPQADISHFKATLLL